MTENAQDPQVTASPVRSGTSGVETPADEARSGADVAEAIKTAESGSALQETHTHPERTRSGEAPVEQVYGDPAMTEGQTVTGSDSPPPGPSPAEAGSGGAQSVIGARVSDRLAAGEPKPEGSPFDTRTQGTSKDADSSSGTGTSKDAGSSSGTGTSKDAGSSSGTGG